jgi:hypothetical protein
MPDKWHSNFDPKKFLSRVDLAKLLVRNAAHESNKVPKLGGPCFLCSEAHGVGLILNDGSYLCHKCLEEVSAISYPEEYESARRTWLENSAARKVAREALVHSDGFRKASMVFQGVSVPAFLLLGASLFFRLNLSLPVNVALGAAGLVFWMTGSLCSNRFDDRLSSWDKAYPEPQQPQLFHFHHPLARLTERDKLILKVFNNWPGYPPFWDYLRGVVLQRDSGRCQVSGCPSRATLHVHHRTPISKGGQHTPNNLVTLCEFHHALEPDGMHQVTWDTAKSKFMTMVKEHQRANPVEAGTHLVHAHHRRLELISPQELEHIKVLYGLACPKCGNQALGMVVNCEHKEVYVSCANCGMGLKTARQLAEETGPFLAKHFAVTRNRGSWQYSTDEYDRRRAEEKLTTKNGWSAKGVKDRRKQQPICPICGAPMRMVRPRQGDDWKAFWGCTLYKVNGCRGTTKA